MKKKTLTLISSCAAIAVCSSLIVGSTYALFTSEDKVDIAVTAGKVAVTAEVVDSSLETYSMGNKQEKGKFENGGTAGFTSTKKLELNYVTPGDKATFEIKITNESTVNVQYRIKWSAEGSLTDALEVNSTVAKTGLWTKWDLADEVKEKTVSLSVELPENVGNEYQAKNEEDVTTISFVVEAVQGNAEVKDEISNIDGVGYESIIDAFAAAKDGDTINFLRSESYAEVKTLTIDKNVTIAGNGEATLENVHFVIANKAEVAIKDVNFEGDSFVNVSQAGTLTMIGCVANVQPEKVSGRVAFIVAPSESQHGVKLNLIGNTVISDNGAASANDTSAAVFIWSWLGDSVISGNTFGSETDRYGFFAVKLMNAASGATFKIEDNTVYGRDVNYAFDAFIIGQNTSVNNPYTVISSNNTVDAVSEGADYVRAFALGTETSNVTHTLTFKDSGTTLNGVLITDADDYIDYDRPNCYLYVNINGHERFANTLTKVSDGLYANADSSVYYVFNADGLKYLADDINNGTDYNGKTIELKNDISLEGVWTPIANTFSKIIRDVTINGNNNTISGMKVEATGEQGYGFIRYASNLTVKNLNFDNAYVQTAQGNQKYGGVVAGMLYDGAEINNVKVTNSNVLCNWQCAVLVGYSEAPVKFIGCEVYDCYAGGSNATAGTLFGLGQTEVTVTDCKVENVRLYTDSLTWDSTAKLEGNFYVGHLYGHTLTVENSTEVNVTVVAE